MYNFFNHVLSSSQPEATEPEIGKRVQVALRNWREEFKPYEQIIRVDKGTALPAQERKGSERNRETDGKTEDRGH